MRVVVAPLLVAGLALAACSNDSDSSTTDSTTPVSSAPATSAPTTTASTTTTSSTTTTTTTTTMPEVVLTILVTNDDGVGAPGIDALVNELTASTDHEVIVVAPAENQSGSSDSTTPGEVTWADSQTASGYPVVAVAGFPADSVLVALDELAIVPDLVISGINEGQNIGPFVELSGTVGAARTAARAGFPALAVSQGFAESPDFPTAASLAIAWLEDNEEAIATGDLGPSVANLNVPTCPTGMVRGVMSAPVAPDFLGRDVLAVDCESTATEAIDDVDAFLNGFATLSDPGFLEP